jgi:aconitate hydratase
MSSHLAAGEMSTGQEIGLTFDQTLLQDATGTMAMLQFEALGINQVRTKRSVVYVDHNTLQAGFENMDDHRYLASASRKYGLWYSRAGNGICHQVHLERFSAPGQTLLGSDSHTTTAGGVGMLAIGAGGLDVAVAMAGNPFYLNMPEICKIELSGALPPWSSAKDVALEMLRRLGVSGGRGKILEFSGPGVGTLSATERATIANMSIETGAFTAVFPSDGIVRRFFEAQGRLEDWQPLEADPDADYDQEMTLDLSEIAPLLARPHSPGNVALVEEDTGRPVDQVIIGSCTNSSLADLMAVAAILMGKTVPPTVSLVVAPGSRQVLRDLANSGDLDHILAAGARLVETACGFCLGMGQAPGSSAVSLRTSNRNFEGRSGTLDAQVYLVSPQTAAASALTGRITDPRQMGKAPQIKLPQRFMVDDSMIVPPADDAEQVEVVRGPNIEPLPAFEPLPSELSGPILLKVGDDITTDDILPGGAEILPLRSNLPKIADYVFSRRDEGFVRRAQAAGGGFIVGGHNYGQGSSREHAALAPRYLGIRAVLAVSYARIHKANLVNVGIVPLEFVDSTDWERLAQGDDLELSGLTKMVSRGSEIQAQNLTQGLSLNLRLDLAKRQREILLAGGLLAYAGRS